LLNHVPVGVCVLRSDYSVVFWNECLSFWTGIRAVDIVGRPITHYFPHLGEAQYRSRIDTVFHGGPPTVFSSQLHKHLFPAELAGGKMRVQQTTVMAVPVTESTEAEPQAWHALITVEDVTELTRRVQDYRAMHQTALEEVERRKVLEEDKARMEEHVRHMQKLESLGVLASGIAHDFNNLLAVIVGNSDIIAAEVKGRQLLGHCNSEIQKAAQRASDLVAQMLAYSGGGTFVADAVDLSLLVEGMQYLLRSSVSKKARLEYALATNLPEVAGDAAQLQQVVMNLVTNASDALGENNGEIRIETGMVDADEAYLASLYLDEHLAPGRYVYLEIKDTGSGLDEESLDRIFDPFFTTKFAGRGLGLAAVMGIVRAHKGGVRVLSIPGQGTAFRIHLPLLHPAAASDLADHDEDGLVDRGTNGVRILLADDEEMVRVLGQLILEQHGYEVVTAMDGDEAIAAFREHCDTLSLVLLDMTMPRKNGYEVAAAVRAIRRDMPIVLCSGYADVEARTRYADLQMDGFLKKPYRMNELIQVVQRVLMRFPF
jgi:signal transduction histidine kinase